MQQLAALFNNFTLSWDLGVVIFLLIAVFMYGFSVGQRRIGLLLVSTYFAYVLAGILPYDVASVAPIAWEGVLNAMLFGVFVLVLFLLLAGSILRTTLGLPKKEEGQWWHLLALSIVTVGLLTASVLALLPDSYYNNLSTVTSEFFVYNFSHFSWALTGIIVLVVLKRTKKKS